MKRLLICLLAVFLVNYGFAQKNQIGYIESGKNWHYVYDTQGKKLSVNTVGEVLSVSGETDSKADSAEIGVLTAGGFRDEFFDHDVEHGACGKSEHVG